MQRLKHAGKGTERVCRRNDVARCGGRYSRASARQAVARGFAGELVEECFDELKLWNTLAAASPANTSIRRRTRTELILGASTYAGGSVSRSCAGPAAAESDASPELDRTDKGRQDPARGAWSACGQFGSARRRAGEICPTRATRPAHRGTGHQPPLGHVRPSAGNGVSGNGVSVQLLDMTGLISCLEKICQPVATRSGFLRERCPMRNRTKMRKKSQQMMPRGIATQPSRDQSPPPATFGALPKASLAAAIA